ncbi:amidase [Ilyonectria robusta]|uniref:amidase n=1 Tax=Ilyonectria robusta TaxID=1079257 RepID=UPI001E8E4195|nr:amidase [Ilyonectria robusta]KAH8670643.1 amidase [Ilyonectria robusta]
MTVIAVQAKQAWQDVVARKRAERTTLLAPFAAGASSDKGTNNDNAGASGEQRQGNESDDVTLIHSANELIDLIDRGDRSCVAVTKAYIQRAVEAHDKTNCLTEIAFDDALKHAAELDANLAEGKKLMLPLHGIPMTLKDQFNFKGLDSTLGYVGRSFSPAADDAALVKMLRSLGAIILAKSNLPQSIMWCETDNPLWGLTTNPLHKDYTPGGSTGGESALLASKASMVGWGTDIGGSIRIPSHMMGLYGFKPSSARLPYQGVPVSTEGQEHVPSSIGPLARSLDTIHLTMTSLIRAKPWEFDSRCVPITWREGIYREALGRPLTIGVLFDDAVVHAHPPINRVLRSAVDVLRNAGHEIIEWNADLHEDCIRIMDQFYTADGCEDIRRDVMAGGEPFIPHVQRLINRGDAISVYQYWQLNKKKIELQQAYLEKWDSIRSENTGKKADIILMPPMPHTSVPHGNSRWVGYTKVWNFLDYTALVIPGGSVCKEDVAAPWDFEPYGPEDEWNKKLWEDHGEQMASLGLPVGLQIVGRKLEEEKVLAAGKVLDDLLKEVVGRD